MLGRCLERGAVAKTLCPSNNELQRGHKPTLGISHYQKQWIVPMVNKSRHLKNGTLNPPPNWNENFLGIALV